MRSQIAACWSETHRQKFQPCAFLHNTFHETLSATATSNHANEITLSLTKAHSESLVVFSVIHCALHMYAKNCRSNILYCAERSGYTKWVLKVTASGFYKFSFAEVSSFPLTIFQCRKRDDPFYSAVSTYFFDLENFFHDPALFSVLFGLERSYSNALFGCICRDTDPSSEHRGFGMFAPDFHERFLLYIFNLRKL